MERRAASEYFGGNGKLRRKKRRDLGIHDRALIRGLRAL